MNINFVMYVFTQSFTSRTVARKQCIFMQTFLPSIINLLIIFGKKVVLNMAIEKTRVKLIIKNGAPSPKLHLHLSMNGCRVN